jgi:predicted kinase
MRKWMRERLQRRKKKPSEPSDQPAPAPLQPAYFDAEPQESSAAETESNQSKASAQPESPDISLIRGADRDADVVSSQPPSALSSDAQPQSALRSSERTPPGPGSSAQANRGRRRRGGRGRGPRGREKAVAEAFAPAAVKGSFPVTPVESEESAAGAEPEIADSDSQAATPAAVTPPAQATPAPSQRPPKGIVVLAIGLPGSGKSSWFKRHSVVPLSSDMMRTLLFDDVREQRYQDLVFSNLRSMLKARLIARRPMNYVDATNLTPQERQHWIKLARDYQYEVHAVFFDVPLEVCIERHQRRDRVVPDDAMRRMAAKLKPPTFDEGFAKITVVRVKKKSEDSASVESVG